MDLKVFGELTCLKIESRAFQNLAPLNTIELFCLMLKRQYGKTILFLFRVSKSCIAQFIEKKFLKISGKVALKYLHIKSPILRETLSENFRVFKPLKSGAVWAR